MEYERRGAQTGSQRVLPRGAFSPHKLQNGQLQYRAAVSREEDEVAAIFT